MSHTINVMEAFDTDTSFESVNQRRTWGEYRMWDTILRSSVDSIAQVEFIGVFRIPAYDRFFVVFQLTFPSKTEFNKCKLKDDYEILMHTIERLEYTYRSNIEWVAEEYKYELLEDYDAVKTGGTSVFSIGGTYES